MIEFSTKKTEFKNIWKLGNIAGLFVVAMVVSQIVFSLITGVAVKLIFASDFPLSNDHFLNSIYFRFSENALIQIFSLILPFWLIAKLFRYNIKDILALKKMKPLHMFSLMGIILPVSLVANIIVQRVVEMFKNSGVELQTPDFNTPPTVFGIIFALITVAATPAVAEEFAFRGIMFGVLRKYGDVPAIIITSFLFAVIHANFIQMIFALIMGLALGFARANGRSLVPCIIMHFMVNAVSVIFTSLPKILDENSFEMIAGLYFILTLTYGGLSLAYLIVNRDKSRFYKPFFLHDAKSRIFILFLSPVIIGCVVFYVYIAVTRYVG